MSAGRTIEWTETTWNPVVGCSPVSAGCANCYAARMTRRLEAMSRPEYAGLVGAKQFNGTFRELPDRLDDPRRWKKPRRVFVNSMSDLFGEGVSDAFIALVFRTMAACPQHTFQILTKRPERAAAWFRWIASRTHDFRAEVNDAIRRLHPKGTESPFNASGYMCLGSIPERMAALRRQSTTSAPGDWPLPNVWIGTSVENQEAADARIPHLLEVPARVRFLSCEPLLGPVDLTFIRGLIPGDRHGRGYQQLNALNGYAYGHGEHPRYYPGDHSKIGWVIAGGESGPKARPMHPDWARSIRDQCVAAGVPFAGRLLDGREWSEFPKEAPDAR